MVYSKVLLLLGAAVMTVTSSPLPEDKRHCGDMFLPNLQMSLSADNPDFSFPNTWDSDQSITVSQNAGPTDQISALVSFPSTGSGSYGCTLNIAFPDAADYPLNITGVAPTLSVYTVQTPLSSAPTWNNVVLNPGVFGTVTVASGETVSINSESCPQTSGEYGLAFVLQYASWVTGQGSVEWTEFVNDLDGAGLRGLYLTFDC